MPFCYILYSAKLNKFYTGATQKSVEERTEEHNLSYFGKNKFTSAANDWIVYLKIEVDSFAHALRIEKHIKRMKSKNYIQNLKIYPELQQKLVLKYEPSR